MPKTKQQKQEILNQLTENLTKQKAMIFVNYKGLKVGDMTNLRNQLKEAGSKLVVSKKTLLAKALKEKGIDLELKSMEGQIGAIFAFEDPIGAVKTANIFGKTNEHMRILGGWLEGEIQEAASIIAIANLPSREELLPKLVGAMAAPISKLENALLWNIKGLVIAINEIKNQKTIKP